MTQNRELGSDTAIERDELDTGIPQSARIYDYLLGGKDNYEADRAVGAALIQAVPSLPLAVQAQREFLVRAVTHLVREAGVRQFLDVGTGIPTANNVHEVAQAIDPDARVMYVDNDPIVLAHARALMQSSASGKTTFIQADLRNPAEILEDPKLGSTLDRSQPIALMLLGIVHHLREADRPYELVSQLVDWLPSGSYLALATPCSDGNRQIHAAAAIAEQSGVPYVARNRAEIERFFEGLEFVGPGLEPLPDQESDGPLNPDDVFGWAGLARKP